MTQPTRHFGLSGRRVGGYRIGASVGDERHGVYHVHGDDGGAVLLHLAAADDVETGQIDAYLQRVEARAGLRHPGIPACLGGGVDGDLLYLAEALPAGESFAEGGVAPPKTVLEVICRSLEALGAAHEGGVVHGGLTLESIYRADDGRIVVTGLGAPRPHMGRVVLEQARWFPDPRAAAPEVIVGEAATPAADLYALGVAAFHLLSGRPPFAAPSLPALIYQHLDAPPPPLRALHPEVPRRVECLVHRLLAKDPEDRPESAAQALARAQDVGRRQRLASALDEQPPSSPDAVGADAPPLVDREDELGVLRRLQTEAGGGIILVAGEAGVGKTRLVQAGAASLRDEGVVTLWGHCAFGAGQGSYGPFLEILGGLGRPPGEPSPGGLDTFAAARWRSHFVEVFGAATDADADSARVRFFDAILEALRAGAAGGQLRLVIEDVHWIDEGSAALVQHLARGLQGTAATLLLTYRTEEDEAPVLAALLQDLAAAEPAPATVRVERLSPTGTRALADVLFPQADLSADFAAHLYCQSQGNPLITIEVLKLMQRQGVIERHAGLWSVRPERVGKGVPERVASLIQRRVEALAPDDRALLQGAAVVGSSFTVEQLQGVAGLAQLQLRMALFRLEKRHRLLRGVSGAYEFAHPKIREALYEGLPTELSREYHRIAAAAARQAGAPDAAALGQHLFAAEQYAEAVPHLCQAAAAARALCDWRTAATLYDTAIEALHAAGVEDSEALAGLHRNAGETYVLLGASEVARARFTQMRDLATGIDHHGLEAEAWHQLSRIEKRLGNFAAAVSACERCLRITEDGEPEGAVVLRARCLTTWGAVDFEWGRYEQAEARWQEALQVLPDEGGPEAANALNNLAALATVRGELDVAWDLYERVLAIDAGRPPTSQSVLTHGNMGMLRADQGRWDEALDLHDQALRLCRAVHAVVHEPMIHLNRAEAQIGKGEREAAAQSLALARRGFQRLGDALGEADALRLRGRLSREAGHLDQARAELRRSLTVNRQFGESVSLAETLYELGLAERAAGAAAAAEVALTEARQLFAAAGAAHDLEQVDAALAALAGDPVAS